MMVIMLTLMVALHNVKFSTVATVSSIIKENKTVTTAILKTMMVVIPTVHLSSVVMEKLIITLQNSAK
jgi:hypothetical protein